MATLAPAGLQACLVAAQQLEDDHDAALGVGVVDGETTDQADRENRIPVRACTAWRWSISSNDTPTYGQVNERLFSPTTNVPGGYGRRCRHRRGHPLTSICTVVELIAATTTKTGLTVGAAYDPDWNYTIHRA